MKYLYGIWSLLFLMLSGPLTAHALQSDFGNWTGIFTQGKFNSHWGWFFESQLRLQEGWEFPSSQPDALQTRANRLLVRPAVRWFPLGNNFLQLSFGYGWTPNLSPERDEHRIWQQAMIQDGDPREAWSWSSRLRLEQRRIEFTEGLAHRVRFQSRIWRYFGEQKNIGPVLWDEAFFNLNTLNRGPKAGLDQNRFFIGPAVAFSPNARLEMGYLNLYYPKGFARDSLMSHLMAVYVLMDLP